MHPSSKRISRKAPPLALIVAAVLSMLLTACTPPASAEVDLSGELPTEIPAGTKLIVADQGNVLRNYLSASGLDADLPYEVEFANFTGGPAVLEAFRAGSADVAPVGDVPPIHAQQTEQQVPIILALETRQTVYQLATAPKTPIPTAADLRGKRIAYAEGTAQQVVVLRALANAGLTTDDVELVRLQLSEFAEALGANEVDAAPLNEPRLTRYLRDYGADGAGTVDAASLGQISEGLSYVYARGEALTDPAKAAALRHFVGVLIEARHWVNTHQQDWIQAYYVTDQQVTAEDGQRILDSLGTTAFPRLDEALIQRQQGTIDILDRAGELTRKVSAADGFDLRFAPVIEEAANRTGVDRKTGDFS